jgi:putative ABC transport system ATP-binding protein
MTERQLIIAHDVDKQFASGPAVNVQALRGISMTINDGDFAALVGPSGSGKTTLLNLCGALEIPTGGTLTIMGRDLSQLSRAQRADLRLASIGFVFQAYNLLPVLTARENVELVLEMQGANRNKCRQLALEVLGELNLLELADRRPPQMSGGQQQRVAVARAVASRPKMVLADEPTANLDSANAEALMELMVRLRDEHKMTFLFSTHDPRVVRHARRVISLEDGRIVSDRPLDDEPTASRAHQAIGRSIVGPI